MLARPLSLVAALLAVPADAGTEQTLTPTVLVTRSPTDPPTPGPTPSPTYSPTECVCEDQMWKYDDVSDQCVRGCGVEGNAYTSRNRCCNVNFGGTGDVCDDWDMCAPPSPEPTPAPTPDPTPSPTPEPTPEPTPAPTPCVCEDQMWTYDAGADECVRGCGVDGNGVAYQNENRCCNLIFGVGSLASGDCNSYDMCAPPTPAPTTRPTQGSTPTVGMWRTGPPTFANPRNATGAPTAGDQEVPCLLEEDCAAVAADLGLDFTASDTFPTKGCYAKPANGKAFFSFGTVSEMSTQDLSGAKERLYCPGT